MYYTVTNIDSKTSADFSHIADVGAKDKLVRSLAYYILKSYEIDGLNPNVARVRITGGTENMKPTPDRLIEMYDGAIVNYLKKVYRVIGTVVLIGGLALIPFLPNFAKSDVPEDISLLWVYLIFLVNTSVSYFLYAYKSTLLSALQCTALMSRIGLISINTFLSVFFLPLMLIF